MTKARFTEEFKDEAFEESNEIDKGIDYITRSIPDKNQATAFRDDPRQIFSDIRF